MYFEHARSWCAPLLSSNSKNAAHSRIMSSVCFACSGTHHRLAFLDSRVIGRMRVSCETLRDSFAQLSLVAADSAFTFTNGSSDSYCEKFPERNESRGLSCSRTTFCSRARRCPRIDSKVSRRILSPLKRDFVARS